MKYKKIALVMLLGVSILTLSGCLSGEFLIGQELQKREEQDLNKQINAERKAKDLPRMEVEPPPVALLYEDRPEGEPVQIININNILAVSNGGTSPTVSFDQSYYLTEILTYHWNESVGAPAGTIALRDSNGKTYGPWQASLVSGVYWVAKPGISLPAGSYTVIDSDPSTWAQNVETGGQGITTAQGIPVK